jgi:hypothetical protein
MQLMLQDILAMENIMGRLATLPERQDEKQELENEAAEIVVGPTTACTKMVKNFEEED